MKCVAYIRVSTKEQDEEVQRKGLEEFAKARNIEILKKHRKSELIFGGSTEMRMGKNMYYVEVCFVTASALSDGGRASTIRRNFYRIIERYAWKTPLGWLMDIETCAEVTPKLEELDKEYRELTGKSFINIYRVILEMQGLKKMLENSTPPERGDVASKLKKILETREMIAIKTWYVDKGVPVRGDLNSVTQGDGSFLDTKGF